MALLRAILRRFGASAHPSPAPRLDPGLEALLGGVLVARPGVPHLTEAASIRADRDRSLLCAVVSAAGATVVVACDRPFALALAQRCLGGPDAPAVTHGAHEALDPRWEGALTVLTSRLLARAFAPDPPPVVRAVTDDLADALAPLGDGPLLAWPWTVSLRGEGARAVVLAPHTLRWDALPQAPPPRRLGDLPLPVSVVAGRARWLTSELASLAPGEVLALDGLRLADGALVGDVSVALGHPPSLARAARLRADGAVDLAGPLEPFMEEHDDEARLAALPVEVTVELAREPFPLAEVSAWRAGEVVTFRARVGDVVTLRANGRAVARGELVDVDGDVGVRVLEVV